MNESPQNAIEQGLPDFSRLSDAELVQQIADLQSMVNAMLSEISRRLSDHHLESATPVDPAQESADKSKMWGGVSQDEKGRVV